MKYYKSLSELHRDSGFPPPENPLISMFKCNEDCPIGGTAFTSDFYMIALKKLKSGVIRYGRTKYDHECGSMLFVKPRQVMQMTDMEFEEDGFIILFHEDRGKQITGLYWMLILKSQGTDRDCNKHKKRSSSLACGTIFFYTI